MQVNRWGDVKAFLSCEATNAATPGPAQLYMHSPDSGVATYPQMCSMRPVDAGGDAMILVNRWIDEGRWP